MRTTMIHFSEELFSFGNNQCLFREKLVHCKPQNTNEPKTEFEIVFDNLKYELLIHNGWVCVANIGQTFCYKNNLAKIG